MTKRSEKELTEAERDEAAMHLMERFPDGIPSPRQIEEQIIAHGFRGQPKVRRQGATLLYTHLRRAWRLMVEQESPESLGCRQNWLFLGASGSGKTFLLDILEAIAGIPVVVQDATQYTETGIVGEDVSTVVTRLYLKAGRRRGLAALGLVMLDEIDKLAVSENNGRIGNGRTGVQRSLLTLLGSAWYEFPTQLKEWHRSERKELCLHGLTVILAGAFAGIERIAEKSGKRSGVGFQGQPPADKGVVTPQVAECLLERTETFVKYGLIPELVGRISHVALFEPLDHNVLGEILDKNVLPAYEKQFEAEGLRIQLTEPARELLLSKALSRQTAARGLEAALSPAIDEVIYEHCGQDNGEAWKTVQLVEDEGQVRGVLA